MQPFRVWPVVLLCHLFALRLSAEVLEPCSQGTNFSCACVRPSATIAAASIAAAPPRSLGVKHIILYRVDFSDSPSAAIASNTAAALISDLNTYFTEMSYGLMSFAPVGSGSVVTDTLRLPEGSTNYDNNFTKFIEATRQVATAAGYAPADFDFDIVCTGAKPFLVFGAVAYVGGPGLWVGNNNFNVGVVGHELGHNLGLPHASFWNTADQSSIGPGRRDEYGDIFDSMGVPGGSTSHFNARFKAYLGWLTPADAPLVSNNGTYRLTAHDVPTATGVRALKITRNAAQDYWIEFRQNFANRWVTNGVTLRWAGPGAENTLLLDTTPATPQLKNDTPVLIGCTFSDRCADIHITPLRKLGTIPESLDVVVNRGPFPGNAAPIVTLSASATNVSAGTPITLEAQAVDSNGDSLAYFWDFGDGTGFAPSQPVVQFAWTRDGEYVARCTVSDMKGGTASDSVVVRVGTISTFVAEGTVTRNGNPVEGALVKAGSRFTYTDSDGTYRLTRLAAGRQTFNAVLDGFNLINASFDNPLNFGPNFSGANFTALAWDLNKFALITTGAVWKYLDSGTAPAADWTTRDYDDTAWSAGRAKLGYGLGNEATVINFGPNPSSRYITTWFRKKFAVEDLALINQFVVGLRRDDGAVVYLNGNELYRENMPGGAVQPSTTALADVDPFEEPLYFKRAFAAQSLLLGGTNILAVELHQFNAASPDLSFDLELMALSENSSAFRPALQLAREGSNMALRWPTANAGWIIHTATELPLPWAPSTAPVAISNDLYTVRLAPTNRASFFQLRKETFCP